jgi:hypothetical protein
METVIDIVKEELDMEAQANDQPSTSAIVKQEEEEPRYYV